MKYHLKYLPLLFICLLLAGCSNVQRPAQDLPPTVQEPLQSPQEVTPPATPEALPADDPDLPSEEAEAPEESKQPEEAEVLQPDVPELIPELSPAPTPEALPETELPPEDTQVPPTEGLPETPAEDSLPPLAEDFQETPEEDLQETPAEQPVPSLPVLMYHHVVPDGTSCNDMTVTVSKLAGDLQWLADHGYTTVLPRELAAGVPLPSKPVLITFDDGYRSNYDLAYPLFQQYQAKAVISNMVCMQDYGATTFLSWDMCREMTESGLVEIGSHTYQLHNLDDRGGNFTPGGTNGIQRMPEESDEAFAARVLLDLQKSHDRIQEELGQAVTFFAYPFGVREPDAESLIESLFPVTAVTLSGTADPAAGLRNLPRWTVSMHTALSGILPA